MPSVLVTGAARGIGRAIVERLARGGWDVYGGVRGDAGLPAGVTPVTLDITDAAQVAALDGALPGRLDAVVNNAGVVVHGPVETLAPEALRRQLEVNLVGQLSVTQAVLPRLRATRGRAVFVSSLNGRISTPLTGAYNASKFALEGLVDALRLEVRPWGVRAVLVEPAQTDTAMWHEMDAEFEQARAGLTPEHQSLYAKHFKGMQRVVPLYQRTAVAPDAVAATVERALTARRPRARYVVGAANRAQIALSAATPTPVLDTFLRLGTGIPRKL